MPNKLVSLSSEPQRYRKGDMMVIPDALSRAFTTYHEVTGDTAGIWHEELVHGKGEVISITTPKKMNVWLNDGGC